jgi:hypothetical protein
LPSEAAQIAALAAEKACEGLRFAASLYAALLEQLLDR